MGRLTTSVSVHVASNVDMVIEAIYENLEAKQGYLPAAGQDLRQAAPSSPPTPPPSP